MAVLFLYALFFFQYIVSALKSQGMFPHSPIVHPYGQHIHKPAAPIQPLGTHRYFCDFEKTYLQITSRLIYQPHVKVICGCHRGSSKIPVFRHISQPMLLICIAAFGFFSAAKEKKKKGRFYDGKRIDRVSE